MTLFAAASSLVLPKIAYVSIMPVLILLGGALLMLAISSMTRRVMDANVASTLATSTAAAALVASIFQWFNVVNHGAKVTIAGAVAEDGFSAFVSILVTSALMLSSLVGDGWMRSSGTAGPEFHALSIVSASGAIIMAQANDLIVVFLGLEILSIALYVLAAFNSRRNESGEAALKYFVLGAFSSAVFVYGIALVYGATGTSDLPQIADYLAKNVLLHDGLLLAGTALLLVGFGFKIAAVPFHLWTPDVYQGSPSPVTGFMAAVAKAGGFAALLRVFMSSLPTLKNDWRPIIWVLALITLLLGAVVAVVQSDIKRMLAYSSINHAGFILLGLQAATAKGVEGSLYYLFAYSFMVIGTFAVITVVGGADDSRHGLDAYRGLASRQPWLAGALAILLVAQAGIPFTTGFLAKLEVISASVQAGSTALAAIAMVSAAIAAFFYLRVIVLMYAGSLVPSATEPAYAGAPALADSRSRSITSTSLGAPNVDSGNVETNDETFVVAPSLATAVFGCVAVTVLFGIWPGPIVDFAHRATLLLVS